METWAVQRYAILMDGAFTIKKLQQKLGCFPSVTDIEKICADIQAHPALKVLSLLRIYFYHAPPAKDELVNPLDRVRVKLATTPIHA